MKFVKTFDYVFTILAFMAMVLSVCILFSMVFPVHISKSIEKVGDSRVPNFCHIEIGYQKPVQYVYSTSNVWECKDFIDTNWGVYKSIETYVSQ